MIYKVAILIDGGFFTKSFRVNTGTMPRIADMQPFLNNIMSKVQATTPVGTDTLLRTYYYDCRPYAEVHTDPSGKQVNFRSQPKFKAATAFLNDLKTIHQMALRLGDISFDGWKIDMKNPGNYIPDFKQKSVDIKLGLDIAWMAGKKTIDKIVLVAGDSDFIAPMKFARREGVLVYLYPMSQKNIKMGLKEHADFVLS